MKAILAFAPLFARLKRPMLLTLALSLLTLAAGIGLLGFSGWFLTAAALSTLGSAFNIFAPSAGVRGLSFILLPRSFCRLVLQLFLCLRRGCFVGLKCGCRFLFLFLFGSLFRVLFRERVRCQLRPFLGFSLGLPLCVPFCLPCRFAFGARPFLLLAARTFFRFFRDLCLGLQTGFLLGLSLRLRFRGMSGFLFGFPARVFFGFLLRLRLGF